MIVVDAAGMNALLFWVPPRLQSKNERRARNYGTFWPDVTELGGNGRRLDIVRRTTFLTAELQKHSVQEFLAYSLCSD